MPTRAKSLFCAQSQTWQPLMLPLLSKMLPTIHYRGLVHQPSSIKFLESRVSGPTREQATSSSSGQQPGATPKFGRYVPLEQGFLRFRKNEPHFIDHLTCF